MRRELWHLVTELLDAAPPAPPGAAAVRITEMTLDLPVEVAMPRTAVGFRLYADVPRTHWAHGLRARPGRLRIALHRVAPDAAAGRSPHDPS